MQSRGLNELRQLFLDFFKEKGHLVLPSFSLVPENDPSILLINAGMTPLKPYFSGEQKPPSKRVATCQKCIRTPDIERVGITSRHATFFEMLGNFSFGDYFKAEAIPWAWEFLTKRLGIPEERLWVSIYEDDDEAYDIWIKTGVPAYKITRLGKEDNFWEHGTGPCGPCSEIHYDRGPDKGCGKPDCKVGCDCDRFIEVWNLVFTQFNKTESGEYVLLKQKNIDTGMGLERLAAVMQGVDNLFEVDTIKNILMYVCSVAGKKYGANSKDDISIRVITDHIRSTVFMIADGVLPTNEGRGYVLRRLIRRAARHGKLLGINGMFLYDVADVVIKESCAAYPELDEKRDYIKKVLKNEEERFEATIDQGLEILSNYMAKLKESNALVIPGDMVFRLHDTYGFPLDLTREIAAENGLEIDQAGFEKHMQEQKEKAREALKDRDISAWSGNILAGLADESPSKFVGYEMFETYAKVKYVIKDGELVSGAAEGEKVTIITDVTPFYAESGGQIGDKGYIRSERGLIKIDDCKKMADGKILHIGTVENGEVACGDTVHMEVDVKRRMDTARNHTATHLLQKALRNVLGEHVSQSGSLVEPERLRFDFSHFEPMTAGQIAQVEKEINERILDNLKVHKEEMPLEEARKKGAMALFGEKYGDTVRVVSVDNYSMELCGGTHVDSTAEIGLIKIISEGGVAAGVRRIEALTGRHALEYYKNRERMLLEIASVLKSAPEDTVHKAESLMARVKETEREIEKLHAKIVNSSIGEIISKAEDINGVKVVAARFDDVDMQNLRSTGDSIRNRIGNGVIILASGKEGKANLVVMATPEAVKKGAHAGNIVREAAKVVDGGGGGRPEMAQAGGKNAEKIDEALKVGMQVVRRQLGN